MKYGCTVIWATKTGDYVFDRELAELEDEELEDDDRSDEQFDRMDRQTELR